MLGLLAKAPAKSYFQITWDSVAGMGMRYVLLAGIAWLLGYWLFKRQWFHRKIIPRYPKTPEVWREVGYSALSVVIFGLVGTLTIYAWRQGWTQMYRKIDLHGAVWFWCSIGVAIVLHDTWFYWTHRAMHHRRLFRWFHRVHHLSHNPTPWAAYAFSPLEAVVQAAIFPLVMVMIPMHPYAFGLFMMWQLLFNIAGHTGYEFYPRWLLRSPLGYVLNTPTNHVMHHEKMRGNYGLYFNVWDRVMGTNHAEYQSRFETITGQAKGYPPAREEAQADATP